MPKFDGKKVIVPTPDELSSVLNNLKCSVPDCGSIFKSPSNLKMHLVKHHKQMDGLLKQHQGNCFACPDEQCKYSLKSGKHFDKIKSLRQHYQKCHVAKSFACNQCGKGFGTESFLKAHARVCGRQFYCSCRWVYSTREALLTHCKRKSHTPAGEEPKEISKLCEKELKLETGKDNQLLQVCIASPPLAKSPRRPQNDFAVFPTHYVAAIALSELSTTFIIPKNCHIGVQTVETKQARKSRSTEKKRKSSQETQTADSEGQCKKQKISAETQTNGHLKRKSGSSKSLRSRKRSTETQTKDPMLFLSSVNAESLDGGIFNESSLSNSSINNETQTKSDLATSMDDDTVWGGGSYSKQNPVTIGSQMFHLNSEMKIEPHGRSSMTSFSHFDKLCNNETQTEIDSLFQPEPEGTSTTETQTTDDLIEDLYSNMCTQTCSDTSDLFDFNFVDIETQTAWPDL